MRIEVLGLGAAAMDIVLDCEALPGEDGFSVVYDEKLVPGGSCANVLVTLANLGEKTGLLAKMGDDIYGQAFVRDLKQSGVSADCVCFRKGGVSLHTYIAVARSGERVIFSHMGDSLLSLSEEEVTAEMLEGVKVFYTDMLPGRPALKLARLCREKSIKIVFDLEVEPDLMARCGIDKAQIEEMLSLCDLFVTFRGGMLRLTEASDAVAGAMDLYETWRPKMGVAVTLGGQGSAWIMNEGKVVVPAYPVTPVDTTGAGDAFVGGLIHACFFQGFSPGKSLEYANACGALKCTQAGPRWKGRETDVLNIQHALKNGAFFPPQPQWVECKEIESF